MNKSVWIPQPVSEEADFLAENLGLPLPVARILVNREVRDLESARRFLYGTLNELYDPYRMKGMNDAVRRLRRAAAEKENVLIFGDYDVDGILSVVILTRALESLGANVKQFIPDRLRDGYGIKPEYTRTVTENEATLVISVDCGIKAVDFVRKAREIGTDVIITDHHQPGPELPDAVAVLNPVLEDSGYPDRNLAGIGVVFKLVQALLEGAGRSSQVPHYLKLVSIGTVADVVRLRDENRLFVKFGLKALSDVRNPGLKSLLSVSRIDGREVGVGDVGFRIGPRINAAGRLGRADLPLQLFTCESEEKCLPLARELDRMNGERQAVEKRILDQALKLIEERSLDSRFKLLILGSEDWHRGVIGIVASKLKDRFNRPVLLFACSDGRAYGSGRSIREFPLIDCLEDHQSYLLNYGGHPMAVGCEMECARMADFKQAVNAYVEDRILPEHMKRKLRIDTTIRFPEIDAPFLEGLERLSPFGLGNPRPIFLTEGAEIVDEPRVLQKKHLKILLRQEGRVFEALGWSRSEWAASLKSGDRLDVVYFLQRSEYMGERRLSLNLADIRPSS